MNAVVKIKDPEGLINTLQARIKQLEGQLQFERERYAQNLPDEIAQAVKSLRLYGVIVLHVGDQDRATLVKELSPNPVFRAVVGQVWSLSGVPVAPEVRDAIKAAANYGMNRWY